MRTGAAPRTSDSIQDRAPGGSDLHTAASEGDTATVKWMLDENSILAREKDEDGYSPLHLASRKGKVEAVKEFLRKDPDLSFLKDFYGRTPLHWAAERGPVEVVREFLEGGWLNRVQVACLINQGDDFGDTALHLAAKRDDLEIIGLLLENESTDVTTNLGRRTAIDILQQRPAAQAQSNGLDLGSIIEKLQERKRAKPVPLNNTQHVLLVVVVLIATVTFQAALSPPGGFWQDSDRSNQTNRKPGMAIQSESSTWLFTFFLAFDAIGFVVSLTSMLHILGLRRESLTYVNYMVVAAILSMELAFIFGLLMICEAKAFPRVGIFVVIFATLTVFGWAWYELRPWLVSQWNNIGSHQRHRP